MEAVDRERDEVLRAYLRAWERADVAGMEALVAEGFEHVVNGRLEDREGLLARVAESDAAVSDRHFEIDLLVVAGSWVACRCRMSGKHTGPLPLTPPLSDALGKERIEPTGRDVTVPGMILAQVEGGRLVSGYGEWDRLALLVQLTRSGGDPA